MSPRMFKRRKGFEPIVVEHVPPPLTPGEHLEAIFHGRAAVEKADIAPSEAGGDSAERVIAVIDLRDASQSLGLAVVDELTHSSDSLPAS